MNLLPSVIDRHDRFVESPPEWPKDVLLNYEALNGENECWFRLRRETQTLGKKIVYIHLEHRDILPTDRKSGSVEPWLINELRKVAWRFWGHWWTTLTISRDEDGKVVCKKDDFKPPYIPVELLLPNVVRYETEGITGVDEQSKHTSLSIRSIRCPNHQLFTRDPNFVWANQSRNLIPTTSRENIPDNYLILKSEPFFTNAPYLAQEAKVYKALTERGCLRAPRLLAYACEASNREQVNGLYLEQLDGRDPAVDDYEVCAAALKGLHEAGVVHGQVELGNIVVTDEGAKFLDFSEATLDLDALPDADKPFGPKVMELWQYLPGGETGLTKHDLEEMKRKEVEALQKIFEDMHERDEQLRLERQRLQVWRLATS